MSANYFDYFNEFLTEGFMRSSDEADDQDMFSEAAKEGVFKDGYIFRDQLQIPHVHDKLSTESVQERIIEFTGMFIDTHQKELSTTGPVHFFPFGDTETKFLYELFGIDGKGIIDIYHKVVEDTYYGKISKFLSGLVESAPHKILLTAVLMDALQNNYPDIVECCEYLWAFSEYPLIYRKFWEFGVKPDVMAYTMENLGSKYKFIQKKMNNVKDLLKYHANISVAAMTDRLKTGADNVYLDFAYRIRNQIKNSFRNISREYYDNNEHNRTLHQRGSTFDDGSIADQEGHTTNMAQIIDNTVDKFVVRGINNGIAKAAAEANQVDSSNLIGYLNQIRSNSPNKIPEFVEAVITAYFEKNPTNDGVGNAEFANFGIALYRSLGSSKDKIYQTIKQILNFWLFDIVHIEKSYSNKGTIINYTRAIFNYMIFMIMSYN